MAKYRVVYGVLLLVCILFFIFFQGYLSHLTLIIALLLPVLSFLLLLPACFCTRVFLRVPTQTVEKKEKLPFFLHVENRWLLPCSAVILRLNCRNLLGGEQQDSLEFQPLHTLRRFPVGARSSSSISQDLSSRWCGKLELKVEKVRVMDLSGLFCLPVFVRVPPQYINVLPQIKEMEVVLDQQMMEVDSDRFSPYHPGNDPSEVFQVREFREGDTLRRVHWKLTQRMGELMVRDFSLPVDHALYFLMEAGAEGGAEELDRLLGAFASISSALIQQGCAHHVGWMEKEQMHWEQINESAELQAVMSQMLSMSVSSGRPGLQYVLSQDVLRPGAHLLYATTPGEEEIVLSGMEILRRDKGCRRVTILLAGRGFQEPIDDCTIVRLREGGMDLEELVL